MALSSRKVAKDTATLSRPAGKTGGGLRSDLKRFTRERLITAALDSFAADGFRATSIERIVELAGTTAPTFYRHFSSKNDLLEPLQERLRGEVRAAVGGLDRIEAIDFQSIRGWLDGYAGMWLRMHKLCVAYWEAMELEGEVAADVIPSSLKTVAGLTHFLARFEERDRDSVKRRLALLIPLLDRAMQSLHGLRDENLKGQMLNEFATMIVLALRHPGPAD